MTTYASWWQIPAHLLPATALGELEYPRVADGDPAAWVKVRENWQGKQDTVALYDAKACPPTTATTRQLAAAANRSSRQRTCADCGAHCQRPLPPRSDQDPRPLCPACRHVALLRQRQAELATSRQVCAQRAAELLGWPDAAVLQVDLVVPPPTPAGRKRPATAARVRAVDLGGARLADVLVRLVGPRAHRIPDGAVAPEDAAPAVYAALLGRRLLMWSGEDLVRLRMAAPHEDLPRLSDVHWSYDGVGPLDYLIRAQAAALQHLAAIWRGQLDPYTRTLIECLAPGAPDRLLLMLRRIANTTATTDATQRRPAVAVARNRRIRLAPPDHSQPEEGRTATLAAGACRRRATASWSGSPPSAAPRAARPPSSPPRRASRRCGRGGWPPDGPAPSCSADSASSATPRPTKACCGAGRPANASPAASTWTGSAGPTRPAPTCSATATTPPRPPPPATNPVIRERR